MTTAVFPQTKIDSRPIWDQFTCYVGEGSADMTHADPNCDLKEGTLSVITGPGQAGFLCPNCIDVELTFPLVGSERSTDFTPGPKPSTPIQSVDQLTDVAEIIEWWAANVDGPKLTDASQGERFTKFATEWAKTYYGNFSFMVSISESANRKPLTAGQAKGTMNCWRNDFIQWCKATAPVKDSAVKDSKPTAKINLTVLGETGRYAVVNGSDKITFYQIDHVAKGKWAGWVFVKRQEGGDFNRLANQKPGQMYSHGPTMKHMTDIVADPYAAMALYGREIGRCGMCNRELTDELSRSRGIGPTCWAKG